MSLSEYNANQVVELEARAALRILLSSDGGSVKEERDVAMPQHASANRRAC
jgi:hypothetical protein